MKKIAATALTLALGTVLTGPALSAGAASAEPGTTSLASVLAADGTAFDKNWSDFDITEAAVVAVLGKNPKSPVSVLADGTVALTAFVPTDRAFRSLARDLGATKAQTRNEKSTTTFLVKAAGLKTIENTLLYHVVPGATITAADAAASNGKTLATALSVKGKAAGIKVKVSGGKVFLGDLNPKAKDPLVIKTDINAGNAQIAHAINRVLLPMKL